jgi:hypothetical protein
VSAQAELASQTMVVVKRSSCLKIMKRSKVGISQ